MKKLFCVLLAAALCLGLAACGGPAASADYTVAIVQQMDHSSLDEIREAVKAGLDALAEEKGITIAYEEFNGQNDTTTLNQIGTQVVSEGYDAIIPIATLAAQCMVNAADGTGIPVIYAAISDPAEAGVEGFSNVTGTSDALNTEFILDMMLAADPDVQTVGLLYSNSEPNSATPIAQAKAYLEEKGIAYVEKRETPTMKFSRPWPRLLGRWTLCSPPRITW